MSSLLSKGVGNRIDWSKGISSRIKQGPKLHGLGTQSARSQKGSINSTAREMAEPTDEVSGSKCKGCFPKSSVIESKMLTCPVRPELKVNHLIWEHSRLVIITRKL